MFPRWLTTLSFAAPSRCAVCARWPAEPVCGGCIARFSDSGSRCLRCALPVPLGMSECGRCLRYPPPLDSCHAAVAYAFPWSGLVTAFKFGGQPGWAASLARLVQANPRAAACIARCELLLPVPLAPLRLRQRGFNQALQLARALDPLKVRNDLLLRLRETAPQTALGRQQREKNVQGAFSVEPLKTHEVANCKLALVDDVMTSGASLHAAARALRAAGAAEVHAIVVARTAETP